MPKQLFSNNASSVLTVGVNTTFTTLTLNDASKFPSPTAGNWFMLALVGLNVNGQEDSWEVVKCTERSVNVLTVVRAQEGTTGIAWGVGTRAELRVTSAFANQASDHFVNTSNPHTVTATQVGLGNVTNTSDANKPVSTAQQTALNLKADSSSLGTMSTQAATAVNIAGGTIDGTVIGGITPAAGTFTNLTTTGVINLGHASDTTLTRSAAGVMTIEGVEVVTLSRAQTLTNKTVALGSNTVSGTLAQFNTAVTDADFASLAGSETLTNKSISGSTNTLSNIANAALTNSSVTINGTSVALGDTVTITASDVGYLPAGTGAVARDVQSKLRESVSVKDFGAVGDGGVTNNLAAIIACIADANGKTILVPVDSAGGDYAITSGTLTIPSTARFEYEAGARIYAAGGAISDEGRHMWTFGGGAGEANSDDLVRGINITLMGGNAGAATATTAAFNKLRIRNDQVAGNTKVDGLLVYHNFGGGDCYGGRHAIEGALQQTSPVTAVGTDRAYCGMVGSASSAVGDSGTLADPKGDYFGGNFVSTLFSGAMHTRNAVAAEFNTTVNTGASTDYRAGIQIAAKGSERGITTDAAISVSNAGGGVGDTSKWKYGLLFGAQNGRAAFDSDSSVIRLNGPTTIDAVINAPTTSATSGAIVMSDLTLRSSRLHLNGANGSIEIGSTASTSCTIDLHSSGQNNDYDARISCEGGTTNGTAGLAFLASNFARFSGVVRPTVDNTKSLGDATYRWSVVYAATGTINTSDERTKTFIDIDTAEFAVAKELKTVLSKFKFNDAIAEKEFENARIHFGIGAQTVVSVFAKYGLDATKYALLCYDEWDAQPEVKDDEGNVIQEYREAGNRYGIRYDELLAFIISAL